MNPYDSPQEIGDDQTTVRENPARRLTLYRTLEYLIVASTGFVVLNAMVLRNAVLIVVSGIFAIVVTLVWAVMTYKAGPDA